MRGLSAHLLRQRRITRPNFFRPVELGDAEIAEIFGYAVEPRRPIALCAVSNAGPCLGAAALMESSNLLDFPSTVLRPGEVYRQVSEYRFL